VAGLPIPVLVVTRDSPGQDVPSAITDAGDGLVIEDNYGNVFLFVTNPESGEGTATITPHATGPGGAAFAPSVIVIPADSSAWVGPWPTAIFNDDANTVYVSDPSGTLEFTGLRY
jgi:hypothetical protein